MLYSAQCHCTSSSFSSSLCFYFMWDVWQLCSHLLSACRHFLSMLFFTSVQYRTFFRMLSSFSIKMCLCHFLLLNFFKFFFDLFAYSLLGLPLSSNPIFATFINLLTCTLICAHVFGCACVYSVWVSSAQGGIQWVCLLCSPFQFLNCLGFHETWYKFYAIRDTALYFLIFYQ